MTIHKLLTLIVITVCALGVVFSLIAGKYNVAFSQFGLLGAWIYIAMLEKRLGTWDGKE